MIYECENLRHHTSFAFLWTGLDIGQAHFAGLIADNQQTEDGRDHTGQARDGQRGPPAVALSHHCGNDGP